MKFKHLKSGGIYEFLMEADLSKVVIYRSLDKERRVWVRPIAEFHEKFVAI